MTERTDGITEADQNYSIENRLTMLAEIRMQTISSINELVKTVLDGQLSRHFYLVTIRDDFASLYSIPEGRFEKKRRPIHARARDKRNRREGAGMWRICV